MLRTTRRRVIDLSQGVIRASAAFSGEIIPNRPERFP
jgi:hypothetical protein